MPCARLLMRIFSTGTLGEKKSNVKLLFPLALHSPLSSPPCLEVIYRPSHAPSSETLRLRDCRCGRGPTGPPIPPCLLFIGVFRNTACQAARECPRVPAICEKRPACRTRTYDVPVPVWHRHRHWTDLSSQLGAYLHTELGRPLGFLRTPRDPDGVSHALFSKSDNS